MFNKEFTWNFIFYLKLWQSLILMRQFYEWLQSEDWQKYTLDSAFEETLDQFLDDVMKKVKWKQRIEKGQRLDSDSRRSMLKQRGKNKVKGKESNKRRLMLRHRNKQIVKKKQSTKNRHHRTNMPPWSYLILFFPITIKCRGTL